MTNSTETLIDHRDGTITDIQSGLMWMKNREPDKMSLSAAMAIHKEFAGYTDWRLPTFTELQSVIPSKRIFYSGEGYYWSCTKEETSDRYNGWYSIISAGGTVGVGNPETGVEYVRLVRSAGNFSLKTSIRGSGSGSISKTPVKEKYSEGQIIYLTATEDIDSKFVGWSGDITSSDFICEVVMDENKRIAAEFTKLNSIDLEIKNNIASEVLDKSLSFALGVSVAGTGCGHITRSVYAETYSAGSKIILIAEAEEGSIFNGWYGDEFLSIESEIDETGAGNVCTVKMMAPHLVGADFKKLTISDTSITTQLKSVEVIESTMVHDGIRRIIFYLLVCNTSDKKARIRIPPTSYLSYRDLTTIKQNHWAKGMDNGSSGLTLHPGTTSEIGLIYPYFWMGRGDNLYLEIFQENPSIRFNFIFKCTDSDSRSFVLVEAYSDVEDSTTSSLKKSHEVAAVFERIEALESNLMKISNRLDAMQESFSHAFDDGASNSSGSLWTLSEIIGWMGEHDQIDVTELRAKLVPLDLMPRAVIDELNERALDMVGELAVEEVGDVILITRGIIRQVLENWEACR